MIAIYARQSVEKKDSISIESQIEYAKREVFSEDFKIYQDSGYSGKNTNRPAFHEMMSCSFAKPLNRDQRTMSL